MPSHKIALSGAQVERIISPDLFALIQRNSLSPEWVTPVRTDVSNGVIQAYYIDGVFTPEECAMICRQMDSESDPTQGGAMSFWSELGRDNEQARAFRDADTVEVQHPTLGDLLWQRLLPAFLPSDIAPIVFGPSEPPPELDPHGWERELPGTWLPAGLNTDFLFVRYPSGGAFAPHSDGRAVHDFNLRSLYSIVLYLNDLPAGCGGGTSFYVPDAIQKLVPAEKTGRWTADPSLVLSTVEPKAGRMLVFQQTQIHEGVPPVAPHMKYIIRSDIMFKRTPAVCDQPHDLEAYDLFRKAETLSEEGHASEAVKLFQRAFKMSPELAKFLG